MNESTTSQPTVAPEAAATSPSGKRKKLLAALFVAAGLGYGAYWATVARYVESTDDAYVNGNVVQITPQVAGTVVVIKVDDTQFVRAALAWTAA